MRGKNAELLLESIDEAIGLTKYDFDKEGYPYYTKWGADENGEVDPDNLVELSNLQHRSLKISKKLGDIYIDKIDTDGWLIVGKGTTLHCDDVYAGMGRVDNFEGFLM